MKFITRKQLLNRTWNAADLDAAAEFWLLLYETAAAAQSFTARPEHLTEVRLRGFPQAEGPLLRDELARRTANSDFRRPVVELLDPDTLALTSKITRPAHSPPHGLGLPLLEGPGFDGLMVEFRITALGAQSQVLGRSHLSFTLVLVGQIVGGEFVLKTLWRNGSSEGEDDLYWHGPWPHEKEWLEAFDDFRESDRASWKLAKVVCVPRNVDTFGAVFVYLSHVPLDKPRFARLAGRWLFFALVFGAIAFSVWWSVHTRIWATLIITAFAALWAFCVFLQFILNESRLWFGGYRLAHANYSTLYRESHQVGPIPPELAARIAHNPTLQKYTADLQAAGFVHLGDAMTEPQSFGKHTFRVFRAPDGVTYFTLVANFTSSSDPEQALHMWPVSVAFLANTHFTEGGYAASVNGRTNGYRRKRSGPEVMARVFTDETDPLEFVRKHMKATTAFAEAHGLRALPAGSLAEFVRHQNAMLEEEQRRSVNSPYTWGDHFWWYLQTPRKVFRE